MSDEKTVVWRYAAKRSEVGPDEAVAVMLGDREIALAEIDGAVHAFDNICTHEYACLSDGFVEGDQVECPLHQARFHIPTGKALTPPACVDLHVYPVKLEGDDVYVGVTD